MDEEEKEFSNSTTLDSGCCLIFCGFQPGVAYKGFAYTSLLKSHKWI